MSLRRLVLATFLTLLPMASAEATPLTVTYLDPVTNWEWAEVNELLNFTWNQIDTVCATDGTSVCAGTLGTKELDGWIWATRDQVRSLFVNSTDLTAAQLGGSDYGEIETNSTWAPQFLTLFAPTFSSAAGSVVWGWTASSATTTTGWGAGMEDYIPGAGDVAWIQYQLSKSSAAVTFGVFLHRPAIATPEPASMLLLGTGLAGIAARRYRQRKARQ